MLYITSQHMMTVIAHIILKETDLIQLIQMKYLPINLMLYNIMLLWPLLVAYGKTLFLYDRSRLHRLSLRYKIHNQLTP